MFETQYDLFMRQFKKLTKTEILELYLDMYTLLKKTNSIDNVVKDTLDRVDTLKTNGIIGKGKNV